MRKKSVQIVLPLIIIIMIIITITGIGAYKNNTDNSIGKTHSVKNKVSKEYESVDKSITELVKWADENDYIASFYEDDTSSDWFTYSYSLYLDITGADSMDTYDKKLHNYIEKAKEYITNNKDKLYYTDYERMTIVFEQIDGKNSKEIGKILSDNVLNNKETDDKEINSLVFALIAMDTDTNVFDKSYDDMRQEYINHIIDMELPDGGFSYAQDETDIDMTAMAVRALAPYYNTDMRVKEVIDRSLKIIEQKQEKDGGFSSYGTSNSESLSQVILALCALDIEPLKDNRFIKSQNMIECLLSYQNRDGGFSHIKDMESDGIASSQAMEALTKYLKQIYPE